MKDLFGTEIVIGSVVGFNIPYYKSLARGTVLRIGTKKVTVEYRHNGGIRTTPVYPEDTVVYVKPE